MIKNLTKIKNLKNTICFIFSFFGVIISIKRVIFILGRKVTIFKPVIVSKF